MISQFKNINSSVLLFRSGILLFLALICLRQSALSQELPIQQLYLWNPSLINPAITGSERCSHVKLIDRHQWAGIKNAPRSQVLIGEKKVTARRTKWHGLGLNLSHDLNGAYRQFGGDVNYAFHFIVSKRKNINLGLGLRGSAHQNILDESDFTPIYDPVVTGSREISFLYNASSGIYLYNEKFHAGFSALQILPSQNLDLAYNNRYYYFTTDLVLDEMYESMILEPGIVLKSENLGTMQVNLNCKFIFKKLAWLIGSYRHNIYEFPGKPNSLIAMLGIEFDHFSFGYAVDIGLTSIQARNYGSHEFMVAYKICPPLHPCPVFD